MPPFTNPAEYLIDVVSIDNRSAEAEQAALERVGRVIEAWRVHCNGTSNEKVGAGSLSATVTKSSKSEKRDKRTSFIQQTRVLTARTWTVTIRDPMGKWPSESVVTETNFENQACLDVWLRPSAWR